MREAKIAASRLKNVLMMDKIKASAYLEEVLKSDVFNALEHYLELVPKGVDVKIGSSEDGFLDIKIRAKAKNIKNIGIVLK